MTALTRLLTGIALLGSSGAIILSVVVLAVGFGTALVVIAAAIVLTAAMAGGVYLVCNNG
jgi:hypothetical protein